MVYDGEDCIFSLMFQQTSDQIHGDLLEQEGVLFGCYLVQERAFFIGEDLVLLTRSVSFDVVCDPVVHPNPFCMCFGFTDSFVSAGVFCRRVVVDKGHDEPFLRVGSWGFLQLGNSDEFFGRNNCDALVVIFSLVDAQRSG